MTLTAAERTLPQTITARGLALGSRRGPVYGPLDLDVPTGWVVAVVGPQGSGRTSLLLTLAGRLRPTSGTVTVLGTDGVRHARFVQRHAAVAGFAAIDDLDGGLRVRELIKERADLVVPLWRRPLHVTDAAYTDLVTHVFGAATLDLDVMVADLSALGLARLRVLLAMIGRPQLVVVDDVDAVRDPAEQRELWRTLQRICGAGVTVVAATTSAAAIPDGVRVVSLTPPSVARASSSTLAIPSVAEPYGSPAVTGSTHHSTTSLLLTQKEN